VTINRIRLLFRALPKIALMLGNIAIGLSVLAPAGMLIALSDDLGVAVHDAGLLVTYGAFVLCISSPLGAWLTTRLDRRALLAGTIAVLVIGEFATAFAPNYGTVLVLRLLMLVAAALYTPQAAATVALIVPEKERPGAMSFVFLGWSLAIAGGLPFITFLTTQFGWRVAFGALGCVSLAIAALLLLALPRGLQGRPLSLASFGTIARTGTITLILLITLLTTSGQFSVAVYLAPLLEKLTGEGPATAGVLFGLMGTMGVVGNVAATRIVERQGVQRTFALFAGLVAAGLALWAVGGGHLAVMTLGVTFLGLGFAAANSMQQARLADAAPDLASASIALNTSLLYVGQAAGSGVGGFLYAHGRYHAVGYVATFLAIAALVVLAVTWQKRTIGAR
jgi:MFS transporter, DHA1 family, inner membrane transport protein